MANVFRVSHIWQLISRALKLAFKNVNEATEKYEKQEKRLSCCAMLSWGKFIAAQN